MKKHLLFSIFSIWAISINAQNLVSNGNFEAPVGNYTVVESSANVLKRVASIYDATTQGTNPAATAGEAVVAGQWVKYSPDDANVKGIVNSTAGVDASAGLNFKIQAGSTITVYNTLLSAVVLQKLTSPLDNTKRYKVRFKAKHDVAINLNATSNNCGGVNILLGDNIIKSTTNPLMVGVILTGGTAWTSYEAILDVPQYVAANPTADFSNAYLGFCISTKIASNKTNNSSFIIDDIELEEFNNYAVKYVKSSATGTGDGSSWANASANLQAMIDAVEYGEVRVAAGLYKPAATINLKDGVHLTGGYAADGSGVRNVLQNKTILDGDDNKRIIQNSNTSNPFRYLTKVDGFVLQNGNSDNGSAASLSLGVMLENCIIRNNSGGAIGAAVYFARNTSVNPYGLSNSFQQTGVIFNSLIINNSSTGGSAAIYGGGSTLYSVVNCVIANNKCTEATTGTGGIFIGGSSHFTQLQNNIFYNNSGAIDALNNIRNMSTTTLRVAINNWFDNLTMPVTFAGISSGNKTKTNIANPAFMLPTTFQGAATTAEQFAELENSDWSLQSISGMKGIGNSTQGIKFPYENFHAILITSPALPYANITKDLADKDRIVDVGVDLGAFEFNAADPYVLNLQYGSTNASAIACSTCDVQVSAGAQLKVNQNKSFNKVTVNAGAKLTLDNGNLLETTEGVILQNTTAGTASFVDGRTADYPSAIQGVVEQSIPESNRNWYVSMPISSKTASNITLTGARVVQRNESQSRWDDVLPGGEMLPGVGYIAIGTATAGTATWTLSGDLNSGKVEVPVTRSGANSTGFNLLGNPYPSYLNWEQVLNLNSTNESLLQSSIWYRTADYDAENSKFNYSFNTYNSAGRISTPTSTSGYIPPMQAFWVRANSAGTVILTNAMRSHGDGEMNKLKVPKLSEQKIIRLQISNGLRTDETVVYFDSNAQSGVDKYDTHKMFNNSLTQPEIYTLVAGNELVINGVNDVYDNVELPIGLFVSKNSPLSIKVLEMKNFVNDVQIYLVDKLLSKSELLSSDTEYRFTSNVDNKVENRFSLLFRVNNTTTPVIDAKSEKSLVYVDNSNKICIKSDNSFKFSVYNALGQKIMEGKTENDFIRINNEFSGGVYVVKLNNLLVDESFKVFVK